MRIGRSVVWGLVVLLGVAGGAEAQPVDECAAMGQTPEADPATKKETGAFSYVVNGSRWSEEKIVGQKGEAVPVSVLFVDVTAKNLADKAAPVPWAEVKDAKGASSSAVLKSYLRACTFGADALAAGESKRAYFVFDVPKDDYTLVVFGGQDDKEKGVEPLEVPLGAGK